MREREKDRGEIPTILIEDIDVAVERTKPGGSRRVFNVSFFLSFSTDESIINANICAFVFLLLSLQNIHAALIRDTRFGAEFYLEF